MASVKIFRAPICSDPAEEVPEKYWPTLIDERRRFCKSQFPADCRLLLFFIADAEKADWLGYGDREKYLSDGLQLDPAKVTFAISGLKLWKPDEPLGFDEAVVLGKREIGIPGGKAGPGRGKKTGSKATRLGRGAAYTLARLRRDHPELAERVIAGEISANAAAIEAGFRKKPMRHCPNCGHEW